MPHCPVDDLRLDDDSEDKTRLEKIVEEVLGEMVSEKLLDIMSVEITGFYLLVKTTRTSRKSLVGLLS